MFSTNEHPDLHVFFMEALPYIINSNESGYLKGCQIIRILEDKLPGKLLSVAFEKTFDCLN